MQLPATRVHPAIAAEVLSDDYASTASLCLSRVTNRFRSLPGSSVPWDVETIRYHSLAHSQIGVPVTINGTGPYEFLVDTGSQITIVEPSLAAELELKPQGDIDVSAVGSRSKAELVIPDLIEAADSPSEGPWLLSRAWHRFRRFTQRFVGFWVGASSGISTCSSTMPTSFFVSMNKADAAGRAGRACRCYSAIGRSAKFALSASTFDSRTSRWR